MGDGRHVQAEDVDPYTELRSSAGYLGMFITGLIIGALLVVVGVVVTSLWG